MKFEIKQPTMVDVKYLEVILSECLDYEPMRFVGARKELETFDFEGVDDVLEKFPSLNKDGKFLLFINIENGHVTNWPKGYSCEFYDKKIVDTGKYKLLDDCMKEVVSYQGYVPECLGHGGYGDYLEFEVDGNGYIPEFAFGKDDFNEFVEQSNY